MSLPDRIESMTANPNWVVDRRFRLATALILIACFVLPSLPLGYVWDPAVRAARELAGESDAGTFRNSWLPLILLSTGILTLRFRLFLQMLPDINFGMLALLAWCVASSLWAPDPATTFRQSFAISGVTLIAIAFNLASWRPDRMMELLRPTATVMLVLSIIVAVVRPDIGIHNEDQFELLGSWRGITYQKNGLGQLAALSLIFWVHAYLAGSSRRVSAVSGCLIAVFLVLKSRSSTSLTLSTIACITMWVYLRPPIRMNGQKAATALALLLLILVPLYLYIIVMGGLDYMALAQPIGQTFGKDATFSGRTDIWAAMVDEIAQHPMIGIGFNAFWGPPGSPSDAVWRKVGWSAPNGHNGYMDLLNDLGLIGFGLFSVFLVGHGRALMRLVKVNREQFALHLGIFVYVIMANLTESGWFRPILITHVIAIFSSVSVSRLLFEERLKVILVGQVHVSGPVEQKKLLNV